jgi:hypothetical protein
MYHQGKIGTSSTRKNRRKLIYENRLHLWDEPYLYRVCSNGLLRRCVPAEEATKIIERYHSTPYGGHYRAFHTNDKIWQSGFFWPTMYDDTKDFIWRCTPCQKHVSINARETILFTTNL